MKWFQVALDIILVLSFASNSTTNPDAKRLYDDLLSNYNKLVRPVVNVTDALTVRIKLKLSQLIDVNLKNQIMTTNLWVEQSWYDYKLKWEPKDYGGVEMLHVPSDHIWRPDIVLYNNADGNFEVTLATKATLNYTGRIEWRPPAIYKSSCEIDVEYFPFDEQTCVMKFGSWTYDGFQVDLRHIDELNGTNIVEVGVDLSEFYTSVEWDILEVPAVRNEKFYTCCDEPYLDITFNITMRRKTLFYTVNLIIPCMGISFLTILVFYLPSDSGEKVSLSISILLSLTVFFLLLAEIIPPTSLVVPLLGKFVLFTMILDTFSICVTVLVLNIHFRSPQTHTMAPWVRTVFINQLPRFLVMQRPLYPISEMIKSSRRLMVRTCNGFELRDQIPPLPPPVALSRLHHSPHKTSRSTSPHLQFRVQSLSMLDNDFNGNYDESFNVGGAAGGLGAAGLLSKLGAETATVAAAADQTMASATTVPPPPTTTNQMNTNAANALNSTTTGNFSLMCPSTVNQETSTTSSLADAFQRNEYQQTGGSLLDHPLTPTKFRQKASISVQTSIMGSALDVQHQSQPSLYALCGSTVGGCIGGGAGVGGGGVGVAGQSGCDFNDHRFNGISASTTALHRHHHQKQYAQEQHNHPNHHNHHLLQHNHHHHHQTAQTPPTPTPTPPPPPPPQPHPHPATALSQTLPPYNTNHKQNRGQLYRQQSTSSTNFSPVPIPLHPHLQHQSTSTCDLLANHSAQVIKSTTTVNSIATTSTLAESCYSINAVLQHQQNMPSTTPPSTPTPPPPPLPPPPAPATALASASAPAPIESGGSGTLAAILSSCTMGDKQMNCNNTINNDTQQQQQHQQPLQGKDVNNKSVTANKNSILPPCRRNDGSYCCLANGNAETIGNGRARSGWDKCPELYKAMEGVTYIADQTRKEEESTRVKEDWKYVAMVLDRLFLWLFTVAVVFGTAGIILQAPTLYDTRMPIDIKLSEIASTTAKQSIIKPIL